MIKTAAGDSETEAVKHKRRQRGMSMLMNKLGLKDRSYDNKEDDHINESFDSTTSPEKPYS